MALLQRILGLQAAAPGAQTVTVTHQFPKSKRVQELLLALVSFACTAALSKFLIDQLDPFGHKKAKQKAAARKKELYRLLGRWVETEGYEDAVAADMVISPQHVDVTLRDVGGLQDVVHKLRNSVLLPLSKPELFRGTFLRPARGLLLYGPPGTGKTMLAKALAKESGACFMNVRASHIQSKWFGDTQKLVSAIFSLAEKLAPCIIFIDEVDALLGKRKDHEHEAMTQMKTEFMQLWDGLLTARTPVMVLAATNRPYELDEAVLRRFNVQLEVPLPDAAQRETILRLMVMKHWREGGLVSEGLLLADTENGTNKQLQVVAEATEGFSGSDLRDMFSEAAQIPIHEYIEACEAPGNNSVAAIPAGPRELELTDLQAALVDYRPSSAPATMYRESRLAQTVGDSSTGVPDVLALLNYLARVRVPPADGGPPAPP